MAGWSIFSDGSNRSASDYFEILKSLKSNGFCLDLDVTSLTMGFDGSKDGNKFRFLFDKLLSVYLNEVAITEALRPLPVILGNGEHVDLFKLFWVVRENGGFDSVSKNNLWGSVMEACALGGSGFLPAIKLVYVKYLHTFDQLVRGGLKGNGITNGLGMSDCGKNLDLSTDMLDQAKIVEKPNELSSTKDESQMPVLNMHDAALPVGEKKVDIDDDEVMILDPSEANENVESRKRKRETLLGMLDWVTEIAKNPGDPGVENLMFQLEQKESRSKEFQGLVLSARNTLHQGPNFYLSKDSSIAQKKQRMHPSMYEDENAQDLLSEEILRCSPRLLSQNFQFNSCSESSSFGANGEKKSRRAADSDLLTEDLGVRRLFDSNHSREPVAIGSRFQANIPEWTGVVSESDSKWLGTQQWPPSSGELNLRLLACSVGKGRHQYCPCRHPGSVECVRFHIAENKMKLNHELGLTFFNWRFHCMGEIVSLSWTEEEERKFKDIVESNPPSLFLKKNSQSLKSFWDQIKTSFPTKDWKHLISYYFNVFVIRRRSYQNRVTPNNIDSDDDESEFESLSTRYGHETLKVPDLSSIFCSQNKQYDEIN